MSSALNFKNQQINRSKTKLISMMTPLKADLQSIINHISSQFFDMQANFSSLLENGKWPLAQTMRQVEGQLRQKILEN